jgi:hypothetical protein
MTMIWTQNIALLNRTITILTFSWNTSGFVKGNYTLWAYAWPVPGETDTEDNTLIDGWAIVAMVGDITGLQRFVPDGKVEIDDVAEVAYAYGSPQANPERYHPNLDINNDNTIDITDVAIVAYEYGKVDP